MSTARIFKRLKLYNGSLNRLDSPKNHYSKTYNLVCTRSFFDKVKSMFSPNHDHNKHKKDLQLPREVNDMLPKGIMGFVVKQLFKGVINKLAEEVEAIDGNIQKLVTLGNSALNADQQVRKVLGRHIEIINAQCIGAISIKADGQNTKRRIQLNLTQ